MLMVVLKGLTEVVPLLVVLLPCFNLVLLANGSSSSESEVVKSTMLVSLVSLRLSTLLFGNGSIFAEVLDVTSSTKRK